MVRLWQRYLLENQLLSTLSTLSTLRLRAVLPHSLCRRGDGLDGSSSRLIF